MLSWDLCDPAPHARDPEGVLPTGDRQTDHSPGCGPCSRPWTNYSASWLWSESLFRTVLTITVNERPCETFRSPPEKSLQHTGPKNMSLETLEMGIGTARLCACHSSPKVAWLSAKRELLGLWLILQGKVTACGWAPGLPSCTGDHQRGWFLSLDLSRILSCEIHNWEA